MDGSDHSLAGQPESRTLLGASDGLRGWWHLVDRRFGIIPLPLLPVILGLLIGLIVIGKVKPDLTTMIPILAIGGFACAQLGKSIPGLRSVGFPAILATFLPSFLCYTEPAKWPDWMHIWPSAWFPDGAHLLPQSVIAATKNFQVSSNFLYLFICCIIVGSILGMNRQVLIGGFTKVFVPLICGTIAALGVGTLVGTLLGLGWKHTLFFVVIPIMAGGVGEGALPLSLGYAPILGITQGEIFAQVLPAVMIGSLTAILLAGILNFVGKKYPHLTGEGQLQPAQFGSVLASAGDGEEERPTGRPVEASTIAAAGLTAITLYLIGYFIQELTEFPAPVLMLLMAVGLKLARAVSAELREGAQVVFRFFAQCTTYPLLFLIGVAMTPWDKLVATFQPAIVITIVSTVVTIMGVGFVVGKLVNLYPIEAAVVNACHSGQGGTGDVAILTSANRMMLMPFAQIATRIGGAATVVVAVAVLRWLGAG
jgi:Na+/citrate or Na+/malate symporter